ncbi:unnamed protein product [Gemmata massiliana]|uniref:Uncharacterized protein n=1 Tax=Gemmata massiliana TaxID=1210884 RepID=A0A6P2DAE5_9BACT|nr:hypothetical protein [Gemmata massiliana]VTR97857.1 unnamed protein product [Gemmata massiliana]
MLTLNRERLARSPSRVDSCGQLNVCPECDGQLFLDMSARRGIELLCTGCFAYEITPVAPPALTVPDVPSALVFFRRAERDVYRAVRALGYCENPAKIMPADIIEWLTAWYAQLEPNPLKRKDALRVTVSHALTRLRDAGFVQRTEKGWVLCEAASSKGGAL